jgi:hypothetical protein
MSKPSALIVTLLGSASLAVGCVGGSSTTCIADGTKVAVARSNGSGSCPSSILAGVTSLNGEETFTAMKDFSCGVTHFALDVAFTDQDATEDSCHGSDAVSFEDLGSDGGSGTDTMTITCANNPTCTATFDVTFTPQ